MQQGPLGSSPPAAAATARQSSPSIPAPVLHDALTPAQHKTPAVAAPIAKEGPDLGIAPCLSTV